MKTVSISLPQIEGIELKSATVDLEKGVVIAEYGEEYGQEDIEKDISEIVYNLSSACSYLNKPVPDFKSLLLTISNEDFHKYKAQITLQLIREAWNKFDEFKPDWENQGQDKWNPVFHLKNGKIEFWWAIYTKWILDSHASIFSFKTRERAEQFGKQFIDLFRMVLTN